MKKRKIAMILALALSVTMAMPQSLMAAASSAAQEDTEGQALESVGAEEETDTGTVVTKEVSDFDGLATAISGAATDGTETRIVLTKDITTAENCATLTIPGSANITLTSSGTEPLTLTYGYASESPVYDQYMLKVSANGTLTVENLTVDADYKGGIVYVDRPGNLILGNKATLKNGGSSASNVVSKALGVYVYSNNRNRSSLTMEEGSKITGCHFGIANTGNAIDGIAVYLGQYATFDMEGGEITNNTAYGCSEDFPEEDAEENTKLVNGGGVLVYRGTFNLKEGTISGNVVTGYGAGIADCGTIEFGESQGSVDVTDNKIVVPGKMETEDVGKNHTGAGIYVGANSEDFEINSSVNISGNIIETNQYVGGCVSGAGLSHYGPATITMAGGKIENNKIVSTFGGDDESEAAETLHLNGAGVYIGGYYSYSPSVFEMTGGTISGNSVETAWTDDIYAGKGAGLCVDNKNGAQISLSGNYDISGNTVTRGGETAEYEPQVQPDVAVQGFTAQELETGESSEEGSGESSEEEGVDFSKYVVVSYCGTLLDSSKYKAVYTDGVVTVSSADSADTSLSGMGNILSMSKAVSPLDTVTELTVENTTVTVNPETVVYTGKKVEPEVTVALSSSETPLTAGVDYSLVYTNNTEVADKDAENAPTVQVIGIGQYSGIVTKTFTIQKIDMSDAEVTLGLEDLGVDSWEKVIADGKAYEPGVTVEKGGTTLTEGKDYEIKYEDNVKPGEAKVTVTGKGSYKGTVTEKFTIYAGNLKDASVTFKEATFTGLQVKPEIESVTMKVYVGTDEETDGNVTEESDGEASTGTEGGTSGSDTGTETGSEETGSEETGYGTDTGSTEETGDSSDGFQTVKLTAGQDYEITAYGDNVNVADGGTVTVAGKGLYVGTKEAAFTISPASIKSAEITLADGTYTYTGNEQKPAVTSVVLNGTTLVEGKDYTISYGNNTDATTDDSLAAVVITGNGNYTEAAEKTFTIGKAQGALSFGNVDLNVNGTATVSPLSQTGDAESNSITYESDNTAVATVDESTGVVTGVAEGTATITATMAESDNYTAATATFTVTVYPADQEIVEIKDDNVAVSLPEETYTFDGTAKTPAVTVTVDGAVLTEDTYTVDYADNVNAGTATVVVTGRTSGGEVYTGAVKKTFEIGKAEAFALTLGDMTVPMDRSDMAVTIGGVPDNAGEWTAAYSSDNSNVASVKSSDGTIIPVSAGEATITVTVTSTNYEDATGSFTVTVTEERTELETGSFTVTVAEGPFTYTGSEIRPAVTVAKAAEDSGKVTLTEGTDYTVTYSNNINAGTATVTVEGIGQYKGEITRDFTIGKAQGALAFGSSALTKTYGNAAFTVTPKVTGDNGAKVTYASSNKNVAAVDAATGKVTIVGAGQAVITATVAEGSNYKSASGSYTLTVGKANSTITLAGTSKTYTGQAIASTAAKVTAGNTGGKVTYTYYTDSGCTKMTTASGSGAASAGAAPKNAGTYYVKATVEGSTNYNSASATAKLTIAKAAQKIKKVTSSKKIKYSKLKKKKQTFTISTTTSAGKSAKVTYKKKSGNSKIKVSSKGKVTVKKGLKKGTYKLKVKVTAKATTNYKAAKTVTKTIKIKVK